MSDDNERIPGKAGKKPARRTARDVLQAIEPAVELVQLRAMEFDGPPGAPPPKAWFCLSRRRDLPAQPSSKFS